jgi:hypothetical protein
MRHRIGSLDLCQGGVARLVAQWNLNQYDDTIRILQKEGFTEGRNAT